MTDANNTMFVEQFRPYHLDDVIGQEKNKKVVLAWLRTGRVPRSVLISGEFSAGKTTIARIVGRTLLCQNPTDGKACGECTGCKNFDKGNHPDYIEVDAASDRGINEMKDLARKLQMMPLQGKKKILVLDEAHQITGPGWQAMLKTMEEPPAHVVILVATTNPEKLPQTIVSRCSVLKLQAVTVEECTALLLRVSKKHGLAKAGLTEEHLIKIAKVTHAHPRNALHALDQVYTMVLDANDGGQTVDNTLINGFISQVAVADVDVTAAAIVRSVLDGKPGGAIKRAEDNRAQADYLLTKVLAVMRQALLYSTSKKLLDPYYKEVIEDCAVFNLPDAKRPVLEAYEAFVRVRIDTADHVVPVADVIDAAIARAGFIMQDFLKYSQTGTKAPAAPAKEPKPEPKPEPAEVAPKRKPAAEPADDAEPQPEPAPRKKPAPADDDPPWNSDSPSKPKATFPKKA